MYDERNTVSIPPVFSSPDAKWSLLSLIFTLFYFSSLVVRWQYLGFTQVVFVFAFYFAFIGAYLYCLRISGRQAIVPVLLLGLMPFTMSYFYAGSGALFCFAAFLSAFYFRLTTAVSLFLVNVSSQFIAAVSFDLMELYFLGPSLITTVGLFFFGRFSYQECVYRLMEAEKNSEIEQLATIAERERIARDMHDLLGHSLSSLALKSELAQRLIDKNQIDDAKSEIQQVADLARSTLSEVRTVVTGLKQTGLRSVIENLSGQLENHGFSVQQSFAISTLDVKVESTLIMLSKEWCTNILRHSKADSVTIRVEQTDTQIAMRITDNGSAKSIQEGNGIAGMKSRVKELNGEISITTDNGVQLVIMLPLARRASD